MPTDRDEEEEREKGEEEEEEEGEEEEEEEEENVILCLQSAMVVKLSGWKFIVHVILRTKYHCGMLVRA